MCISAWRSDVCSSYRAPLDSEASFVVRGVGLMLTLVSALNDDGEAPGGADCAARATALAAAAGEHRTDLSGALVVVLGAARRALAQDRKSTRLNSSH